MTLFNAIVNFVATILVYGFVAVLFWQAFQTIWQKLRPKEPQTEDYGGEEYE